MSIGIIILFIIVIILFIIGLAGIVLPVIPSLPVIWIGILLYAIITNFNDISVMTVVVTGLLMFIGTVLDIVAGVFGARMYGASWVGVFGACIGSVIGVIIFNIIGLIIGSFVGAFIGEFVRYKKTHPALKAGVGTIFGFIFGVATKIFISFLMIGIFFIALFF